MKYQIDQSGKIEQTNWPTIIVLSNGTSISIRISAIEKQKLIRMIIDLDRPHKTYSYKIFAALVFILLQKATIQSVLIDEEYQSHSSSIKEILVQLFEKFEVPMPQITFGFVGKKSLAHKKALATFKRELKPDLSIRAKDIIAILYRKPTKKGWRPRSSRGSP